MDTLKWSVLRFELPIGAFRIKWLSFWFFCWLSLFNVLEVSAVTTAVGIPPDSLPVIQLNSNITTPLHTIYLPQGLSKKEQRKLIRQIKSDCRRLDHRTDEQKAADSNDEVGVVMRAIGLTIIRLPIIAVGAGLLFLAMCFAPKDPFGL